jgi:hypothetical protein
MKVTFYKNETIPWATPWATWEHHHKGIGIDYSYSYKLVDGEWINANGDGVLSGVGIIEARAWVRKAYNIYLAEIIVGSRSKESRAVIQL